MRAPVSIVAAALATVATLAGGPPAHAGTGAALVRYLPAHASQVIAVDFAHARSDGSAPRIIDVLRHSPRWDAVAAARTDLAGAIDTLVAGVAGEGPSRRVVVIVDGRTAELLAHLPGAHAGSAHAGVTIYAIDGGEAAIVDRHLVIAGSGELAGLIDHARGREGALSDAMTDALDASAASASDVWAAGELTPSDRAGVASILGDAPLWAACTLAVAGRANLVITVGFADLGAAARVDDWLQQKVVGPDPEIRNLIQTGIGPELAGSLAVVRDRREVRISGSVPGEGDEIDALAKLVGNIP